MPDFRGALPYSSGDPIVLHADIVEAVAIVSASAAVRTGPKGTAALAIVADFASGGMFGDKIRYDPTLGPKEYGNSYGKSYSPAPRIEINAGFIGDTATTALILAHEALHRAIGDDKTIEGELLCRAQDAVFGNELNVGVSYFSPATGAMARATLLGSSIAGEIAKVIASEAAHKSLDYILWLPMYQPNLKAYWVLANYKTRDGGLRNRDANTLGHFLRVLIDGGSASNAPQMVDILEAIPTADWPAAKRVIGDLKSLKKSLRLVYNSMGLGGRISTCEKRFGESFHI